MCRFNSGVRVLEYPWCVPKLTFNLVFLPPSAAAKVQVVLACRVSVFRDAVAWRPVDTHHIGQIFTTTATSIMTPSASCRKIIRSTVRTFSSCMSDMSDAFLGFTISMYEYGATIPTLWDTVKGKSHTAS